MNHDKIYEEFIKLLNKNDGKDIIKWEPARRNSIYILYKNGAEYIFSYNNEHSFSFETVEHFIERE